MDLTINDKKVKVPTDLSEITLGRFIDFYDKHGRALDEKLNALIEATYEDELDRELDLSQHADEEAMAWFSFWFDLPLSEIMGGDAIELLSLYRGIKNLLLASEAEEMQLPETIDWNGEAWYISDFKVTATTSFTFNELITSKEVVRQLKAVGKGKWDSLPWLCAVFLRKVNEPFSDDLVADGSERMALLLTLPMSIAIKVAFFLTVSVNIWSNISAYSKEVAEPVNQS